MPVVGVSITKRAMWEGQQEEFSNIYHFAEFDLPFDIPGISDTDAEQLANNIADAERPIHGTNVDFVRARVWGPTDAPPSENVTIGKFDLSGTGSAAQDAYMCLEDCILVRVETDRLSIRDRKVYLRKWYRTMGDPDGLGDMSAGVHNRSNPLPAESRQPVVDVLSNIATQSIINLSSFPDDLVMSSPSGRRVSGTGDQFFRVEPYLETHDVKY